MIRQTIVRVPLAQWMGHHGARFYKRGRRGEQVYLHAPTSTFFVATRRKDGWLVTMHKGSCPCD
jgi:hypothetical protein